MMLPDDEYEISGTSNSGDGGDKDYGTNFGIKKKGTDMMLKKGHLDDWGFLPSFLNENNPKTTIEQLNDGRPGGWFKFEGFTFDPNKLTLTYPGDSTMRPISIMQFRDDTILLFRYAWVLVLKSDGTWEVARCD